MAANRSKSVGQASSEVLEAAPGRMPKVRAPDSPVVFWGGMGGAILAGLLVFNGMNTARGARAQTPPPPPAEVPAPPAPAPQPVPMPSASPAQPPPPAMPVPQAMSEDAYLRSPTLVVDLAPPEAGTAQAAQPTTAAAPAPGDAPGTAEERFAARTLGPGQGGGQAVQMRDLSRTVPQGVLIAAVLESAINSDLPGAVRGVVSRDVRSFDGGRVLIPRGSRLIGQYKSAATLGQTRAFVVWNRIITPAGISIDIASPAVDRLGRGGVEGDVDTHFLQRYGGAILLTVLNAGMTAVVNAGSNSGSNTLVLGYPGQVGQAVTGGGGTRDIPATLRVPQGAAIQVFVARDLDFSSVIR